MPFTTEQTAQTIKPALDPFHALITARFANACKRAEDSSRKDQCTVYVNATIIRDDFGIPYIHDFTVSDWYGGETVTSFHLGKERTP
jgi:hypothetical protein